MDHGQGTLDKIAEVVSQIRIYPMEEAFMGEIAIQPDGDFPEQEISQRVCSQGIQDQMRIKDIAFGF